MAVMLCFGAASHTAAQQSPNIHYRHSGEMPPGAIGRAQLQRGGPLPGYFQPVAITAPQGTRVSLAAGGTFDSLEQAPRKAGMLIGQVYRLRVSNIPLRPGDEVFPTIEVIDRIYPPLGREAEFPIPIQLTTEDLTLAAGGKFVTRVIYVEDPKRALPIRELGGEQTWFEVNEGADPLRTADELGRPVAILRIGARVPDGGVPNDRFLFGSPPWLPVEVQQPPSQPGPGDRDLPDSVGPGIEQAQVAP